MEINKTEFLEAGVQFGHYRNRWHPRMREFIFSVKNGVHIIDSKQIIDRSTLVCDQVREMASRGESILFVGRKKQISGAMKEYALECGSPFLIKKWPGGFLTNFRVVMREVNNFQYLDSLISSEHFKKLIKKEQVRLEKKRDKLKDCYEGVIGLKSLPKALFIMGLKSETTAVKEARIMNIPIISICDTDTNPVVVDYLIPGNDDGVKSVNFFVKLISTAIKEGSDDYREITRKSSIISDNDSAKETDERD